MSNPAAEIIAKANDPDAGSKMTIQANIQADSSRADIPAFDGSRERQSSSSPDAVIRSSKQVTLADEAVEASALDADASHLPNTQLDDKLREMLQELDPNDANHYAYAAYFAQLGDRSGMTYYLPTANGTVPIQFEEGLFVTTSKFIVDSLRQDLETNSGISRQIKEITQAQYRTQIEAAEAGRELLARTGGMTNTSVVQQDAQEIIAAQKRQIAELEAKLANAPKPDSIIASDDDPAATPSFTMKK